MWPTPLFLELSSWTYFFFSHQIFESTPKENSFYNLFPLYVNKLLSELRARFNNLRTLTPEFQRFYTVCYGAA